MRPPATKPIEPAVPVSRVEGRTKITYAPPPLNTQPPSGQLPPPPVGRGGGQNHSNPSANSTPPHAAVKQELTGPGPGSRSSSERANNQSSSSDSSSSSSSSSDGSDRSRSPGRYAGNGDRDVRRTGMYNSPSPPADARRWLESRRYVAYAFEWGFAWRGRNCQGENDMPCKFCLASTTGPKKPCMSMLLLL